MSDRREFKPGNMLNPNPVVMVSCGEKNAPANIITIAWVGTVCTNPPMLSVSIRPERYSHGIIERTGEFAVNLVNEALTKGADFCGVRSGRDVDKFEETGLTPIELPHISCPGIAESPVILECSVRDIIRPGSHDIFLAEVVGVSVDEEYMDEKDVFHINDAGLVVYSHGEYRALGAALGTFGYSVMKKKTTGKRRRK